MNPKEKADYIYQTFINIHDNSESDFCESGAIQSCGFMIDEIIESNPKYPTKDGYDNYGIIYWQKVKREIELL